MKGATTNWFVYSNDDGQLLGEYNSAGQPVRIYVYLEGERVAMLNYNNNVSPPTVEKIFLANNHIGQAQYGWDEWGNPRYSHLQTPFGEGMIEANGIVNVPVKFPGQIADAESGFNQNWNRDYDPSLGRYLQSDPVGQAGGINTYGYVEGNPVMFLDLFGLHIQPDPGAKNPVRLGEIIAKLKSTPKGRGLYSWLEQSPHSYIITDKEKCHDYFIKWKNGSGGTINIDPDFTPTAMTDDGPQPIPPVIALAHELGHAAGTGDTGTGKMDNVITNENPIRGSLGYPERTAYEAPPSSPPSCGCSSGKIE